MGRYPVLFTASLAALTLWSSGAAAQSNHEIVVGNGSGVTGQTITVPSYLNFPNGEAVAGFSFSVCHDPGLVAVHCTGGIPNDCVGGGIILPGSTLALTNGGDGPDFFAPATATEPVAGWTVGSVVNLLGGAGLDPQANAEIVLTDYELLGPPGSRVALDVCSTGDPLVLISIGLVGGGSAVATGISGLIEIAETDPPFAFLVGSNALVYDPATGAGSGDVTVQLDEFDGNSGFPNDTFGFSFGLRYDSVVFVDPSGVSPAPVLQALNGGAGPEEFSVDVNPANGPGITVNVLYALSQSAALQLPQPTEMVVIEFQTDPAALVGDSDGRTLPLIWANDLGDPQMSSQVMSDVPGSPELTDGEIQLIPLGGATPFIRGDCNDDGIGNVADGIFILNALFHDGPVWQCAEACTAEADGKLTVTDAIYILIWQFLDGPPPSAPYPECGVGGIDCEFYGSCQ